MNNFMDYLHKQSAYMERVDFLQPNMSLAIGSKKARILLYIYLIHDQRLLFPMLAIWCYTRHH
jgi:hypothetical protein